MITKFRPSLGERLLGLLFPPRCLTCRELVTPGQLFCGKCRDSLPEEPLRRLLSLEDGGELEVRSVLTYEDGFRETLHDLKFHGQRALAKSIGKLMAEAAKSYDRPFTCVAYVSMLPGDRRKQGYDHSQLLAKYVAKNLGLPLTEALEKVRRTETQHSLDAKARKSNLRNAYRVKGNWTGQAVLLVDDIVTTGSTLIECAQTLRASGAEVRAVCAADTSSERWKERKGDETHGHGKN